MSNRLLLGLTVLFAVSTLISVLVHWLVVCRELYRKGARFPTGFLPWRFLHEMHLYLELSRAQSDSLSWYYILMLGFFYNLALGVVVAILWLSHITNPPP